MRIIVTSQQDIAGRNIYNTLVREFGFKECGEFEDMPIYKKDNILLVSTKKKLIEAEHLDDHFKHYNPSYYVFGSRHRSRSNERTLTVHVPGNLTEEAILGGKPKSIAYCNADAMKVALIELKKAKEEYNLNYNVSLEATHHGPTELKTPVLFVEVGSDEEAWNDMLAVKAVARACLRAAENIETFKKGIGIGGNHYAPRHTEVVLNTSFAIGHIIPSYAIDNVDEEIIKQAIEKTGAEFIFIDYKSLNSKQMRKIKDFAKKYGIKIFKERDLKKMEMERIEVSQDLIKIVKKIDESSFKEFMKKRGCIIEGNIIYANIDKREIYKKIYDIIKGKITVEGDKIFFTEEKVDVKKLNELGIKPGKILGEIMRRGFAIVNGKTVKKEDIVKRVKNEIKLRSDEKNLIFGEKYEEK